MTRRLALWSVLLLSVAVGAVMLSLGPLWAVLLTSGAMVWFVVPGVLLARRLYGPGPGGRGAALLVGPAWGFALSSLVLLALWAVGIRHWAALLVAPLLAMGVLMPARRLAGVLSPPLLTRSDIVAVVFVLALVPAIVGVPFSHVGRDVPDGRAYRAYFTADFVWQMAVVAEVSKGEFPPRNQFLSQVSLRYYWLPHLFSSVEYRHLAGRMRLEALLLMNSMLLGLAFMACLYGFARQFVQSPGAVALGCAGAVCLTSFEGAERLIVYWRTGVPLAALRNLNIDAVSRWFYGAPPTDGLQRLLLYQPQHHAMAYAVGMSALMVLSQVRTRLRFGIALLVGCLLGASLLLSSFLALMITAVVLLYGMVLLIRGSDLRSVVSAGVAVGAALAGALALAVALGYVDRSASVLELAVNRMALRRPVLTLFLNFGPMLIAGVGGLLVSLWRRAELAVPLGLMVAVGFLSYYFVNVRDVQDVYVAFLSGRLIFIALAPLAAYLLQAVWAAGPTARRAAIAVGVALVVGGLPMTIIDVFNTQDTENRAEGPGFPWTVVVTHDEVAAFQWIREHTPPDARVQIEPYCRGRATWAHIPAFAERRMAAGLPLSMVPLKPYEQASGRVRELFRTSDPRGASSMAGRLGIDYLVIGPPERREYPAFASMVSIHPELFEPVFRTGLVGVYRIVAGSAAGSR